MVALWIFPPGFIGHGRNGADLMYRPIQSAERRDVSGAGVQFVWAVSTRRHPVCGQKKNTGLLWSSNNDACLREVRGKGALLSEQGCCTTQLSCLLSLLLMLSFLNGNKLLCPSGDHLLSQSDSSQLLAGKKNGPKHRLQRSRGWYRPFNN